MATHSSSFLENPMDVGAQWATVHRVAKSRIQLSDLTFAFTFLHFNYCSLKFFNIWVRQIFLNKLLQNLFDCSHLCFKIDELQCNLIIFLSQTNHICSLHSMILSRLNHFLHAGQYSTCTVLQVRCLFDLAYSPLWFLKADLKMSSSVRLCWGFGDGLPSKTTHPVYKTELQVVVGLCTSPPCWLQAGGCSQLPRLSPLLRQHPPLSILKTAVTTLPGSHFDSQPFPLTSPLLGISLTPLYLFYIRNLRQIDLAL